jgi:peptidyl-prolyl cis-trans isomerase SurA
VEVAHILIRKEADGSNATQAQGTAQNIHKQLSNGGDFETLAKQFSQDQNTAEKGGYIGFIGINRYEKSFEDAAFALDKDQAFSQPFETRLGWHIVRRISKREIQPFDIEKGRLEQSIRNDERFEIAKKAMVERIKKTNNFTQTTDVLKRFQDTLSDAFLTFQWRAAQTKPNDVLFILGNTYRATLGDYMDYVQQAARERIQLGRTGIGISGVINELYASFVTEKVLEFEEERLEEKYPDFKALMREYEEGILLFEATKMLVWDKASQDTVGLNNFFKTVDGKYKWEERAVVTLYSVSSSGIAKMEEIRQFAATHSPAEVLEKFNGTAEVLSAEERTYEKGRDQNIDALEWKAGMLSENTSNPQTKSLTFYKVESVLPPSNKTLKDARGYVVADYQDYLEKQWVAQLRQEFDVKINKKVLAKMTKK